MDTRNTCGGRRVDAHAVAAFAEPSQHAGMALWERRAGARKYRARVLAGVEGNGMAEPGIVICFGKPIQDRRVFGREDERPVRLCSATVLVRSQGAVAHSGWRLRIQQSDQPRPRDSYHSVT